jgi:microcystin-dependent protein
MSNSAIGATGAIAALPAGVMIDYAATVAPAGWLMCDGSAVSRTTFASLFATISTLYGVGDGSTTFNLPDFRGRFARYMDNMGTPAGAASRDTGRVLGAAQANSIGTHSHSTTTDPTSFFARGPGLASGSSGGVDYYISSRHSHDTTTAANSQGGDTRPINLACNRIIKV